MEGKYKAIKGTKDILPVDSPLWQQLEQTVHDLMNRWGYGEIRTPAFERTELFARSVGEDSDIVSKQMYTFLDQSDTNLTLKPELTAPVMRAYLEHNMDRGGALTKLYYIDALFRQERPQKGRLRQFHQFGAEAIGSPHPEQDIEIIALAYRLMEELGVFNLQLQLNNIGSKECRNRYRKALVEFLSPEINNLSETSRQRLETNPLRILDTKDEGEQVILKDAPRILDFLDDTDQENYEAVQEGLDTLGIPYEQNDLLVRGLDYYGRTTFEITSDALGAQNALCGGGRYDDLLEELGGKSTPAVGFAAGIERILLAIPREIDADDDKAVRVFVLAAGEKAGTTVMQTAMNLRSEGIPADFDTLRRSLKAQMREANRLRCVYAVIIGEDEMEKGVTQVKDLSSGDQKTVKFDSLSSYLTKELKL